MILSKNEENYKKETESYNWVFLIKLIMMGQFREKFFFNFLLIIIFLEVRWLTKIESENFEVKVKPNI